MSSAPDRLWNIDELSGGRNWVSGPVNIDNDLRNLCSLCIDGIDNSNNNIILLDMLMGMGIATACK